MSFEDFTPAESISREELEDPAERVFQYDFLSVFSGHFPNREQAWHAFWMAYLAGYARATSSQPDKLLCKQLKRELGESLDE